MDRSLVSVLANNLDIDALKLLYVNGSDDIRREINQPENIRLLVQRLGWTFLSDYNEEYNRLMALYADDSEKLKELEEKDDKDETFFDALDRQDIKTFDDVIEVSETIEKRETVYNYILSFFTSDFYKENFTDSMFYSIEGYHPKYEEMLKSQRAQLSAETTFGQLGKIDMLIELIDLLEDDNISNVSKAGHKRIERKLNKFLFVNGRLTFW
ncbi:Hypothetical protein POVR1_LOCUS376 [uncultured virus]|nr:Hypothetical protein POVR1_LOCUS376 [uncultured virus]